MALILFPAALQFCVFFSTSGFPDMTNVLAERVAHIGSVDLVDNLDAAFADGGVASSLPASPDPRLLGLLTAGLAVLAWHDRRRLRPVSRC